MIPSLKQSNKHIHQLHCLIMLLVFVIVGVCVRYTSCESCLFHNLQTAEEGFVSCRWEAAQQNSVIPV